MKHHGHHHTSKGKHRAHHHPRTHKGRDKHAHAKHHAHNEAHGTPMGFAAPAHYEKGPDSSEGGMPCNETHS